MPLSILKQRGIVWHQHKGGAPDVTALVEESLLNFDADALTPSAIRNEAVHLLCLGDSLTHLGYPAIVGRHLRSRFDRSVIVSDAGQPGYTTDQIHEWMQRDGILRRQNPDLITILLGTNDVRIDRSHRELQSTIEAYIGILRLVVAHGTATSGPPTLLMATIPPVRPVPYHFSDDSAWRVEHEINPAIEEIAARLDIPLINVHSRFSAEPDLLPPDDVHPVKAGQSVLAELWVDAVLDVVESG